MVGRKLTFEQLQPGMLTNHGLIVRTAEAGAERFYEDDRAIYFFDVDDLDGRYSRAVKEGEEFVIVYEQGTEEYKKLIQRLVEKRYEYLHDAETDIDLLRAYMNGAGHD